MQTTKLSKECGSLLGVSGSGLWGSGLVGHASGLSPVHKKTVSLTERTLP